MMRRMVHPPPPPRWGLLSRWVGPVLVGLTLASCSLVDIPDAPLDSLEPAGPFARQIDDLFWLVFWIAAGIFVVVQGGILAAVFLFRDREGRREPKQIHGSPKLEVAWTVVPALILAVIAVPTLRTLFDLTECGEDAITVEVIGHQWWFEYRYPDSGVETANVLVIPAGREVCLEMTSDDVIHSFWVPKLNGKRDVVPGQTTLLRIQADQPGLYWGHCAEFCGLSHSLMRARVRAVPPAEFEAWLAAQQQPATPPEEGTQAYQGLQVFLNRGCTQCHTVDYGPDSSFTNIVPEEAFNGPNLTHFADREVFAGAAFPYEGLPYDEALRQWLADPPKAKPGSFMPDLGLTAAEIEDLIAWLKTLE
ncbi:MAG: cytochrome c oxidase subunit 2 [Acidimicrobiia bacterium]|nr:MAG: cytochrome c oxidase subunit 2 [Acidimicrobiia bacterium]